MIKTTPTLQSDRLYTHLRVCIIPDMAQRLFAWMTLKFDVLHTVHVEVGKKVAGMLERERLVYG